MRPRRNQSSVKERAVEHRARACLRRQELVLVASCFAPPHVCCEGKQQEQPKRNWRGEGRERKVVELVYVYAVLDWILTALYISAVGVAAVLYDGIRIYKDSGSTAPVSFVTWHNMLIFGSCSSPMSVFFCVPKAILPSFLNHIQSPNVPLYLYL